MKIKIELPDWAENRTLLILADQELVAIKYPNQDWKIKKVRCDKCGECCLDIPDGHTPFGSDDEGKCNALKKQGDKWICTAGHQKPYACLEDPVKANISDCCIEYF